MPVDFPAIVLSRTGTGLATIRCLSAMGVDVHAAIFSSSDSVYHTRLAKKRLIDRTVRSDIELIRWLIAYAQEIGGRPMIFPTSDADTLLLANHREELAPWCRLWNNSYEDLISIVSKGQLYPIAAAAGVNVVPSIEEPTAAQLKAWASQHPGPYLIKPGYEASPGNKLGAKNISLDDESALIDWADRHDLMGAVIQRKLRGGDSHIFDCYGLCNAQGEVVTVATHRRWRQHLPDVGATSFGEIPASLPAIESVIVEQTLHLLKSIKYHGIFGIEWLRDTASDEMYLIDFNARPFSTISHLADCGVNLPYLAAQEMAGANLSHVPLRASVSHKFWVDFGRDFETFTMKQAKGELGVFHWLLSLLRCRSFAYWCWYDPGPSMHQLSLLMHRVSRRGWRAAVAVAQLVFVDF